MRRLVFALMLVTTIMLSGCGAPEAAAPTATPRPTREAEPTPRPTRERPTAAPTEAPTEVPTEDAATGLAEVVIDGLEDYTHPTGVFSMQVPSGWSVEDNSSAGQVFVSVTDPTVNAVFLIAISENTTQLSEDDLRTQLDAFVEGAFSSETDFALDGDVEVQNDGSLRRIFVYTTEVGGVTAQLLGNTFIEQRGNLVSLLTFILPDDQFDNLASGVGDVLNSYSLDTSVSLSGSGSNGGGSSTGGVVDLSNLQTYEHPTGVFSIDIPGSWSADDQSEPGQSVFTGFVDPSQTGRVLVVIFPASGATDDAQLTEVLRETLDSTFGANDGYDVGEPETQADGSIRYIFNYNEGSELLLGNSYIERRGDLISILTFVIPDAQFDALVGDLGTIINSYRINTSARP